MDLEIPEATEQAGCPICDATNGVVVGTKGRFNMPLRNVCCERCGAVYVSPRPSAGAMDEYYRSTYRKHYGGVGYMDESGRKVLPGDAGYEATLTRWHRVQADNALALGNTPQAARVLEIGCRHGKTLELMREKRGISAWGIEPGEDEAALARKAGIDCFTGSLEQFETAQRFDQVQCFHVLEHLHEPLRALLKIRRLLEPQGTLLIEVPNVYQPYGLLEENFFQNVHLASYSPNTLPALLRRAGFEVVRVVDAGSLFAVARADLTLDDEALPLTFSEQLLDAPDQDMAWVAIRLQNYATIEKLVTLANQRGSSAELVQAFARSAAFPAFVGHLAESTAAMVEKTIAAGQLDQAAALLLAVARGPHPEELRRKFHQFAERMGAPADASAPA